MSLYLRRQCVVACLVAICLCAAPPSAPADAIDDMFPAFRVVADDLNSSLADGQAIGFWYDSGPLGLALGPARYDHWPGEQRSPILKKGAMNGHSVVRFDGSQHQVLTTRGTTDIYHETSQTFVVVFSKSPGEVDGMLVGLYRDNDTGNNRKLGVGRIEVGGSLKGVAGALVGCDTSWGEPASTGLIDSETTYLATMEIDGSALRLYLNGVWRTTRPISDHSAAGFTVSVGGTETNWRETDDFFTGDVAEVILFDRLLSSPEKDALTAFFQAKYIPPVPGDMDGSGFVTNNDISPFAMALTNRPQYLLDYPHLDPDVVGDIDGSGAMTNNDIAPFVTLLTTGSYPRAVPEPAAAAMFVLGALPLLLRRRRKRTARPRRRSARAGARARATAPVSLLALVALVVAPAGVAQADPLLDLLTAAEQPVFRQGHTLPPLATWGPLFSFEVTKELADHWGYALKFGGVYPSTIALLDDPNSLQSRVCALAASDPQKYPMHVVTPPAQHLSAYVNQLPAETWARDADGKLILDGNGHKVWSTEAPDATFEMIAEYEAPLIQAVLEKAPIAILTNGGEYGTGYLGGYLVRWEQDPTILAAKGDMGWYQYSSRRKAHQEQIITDRMRELVPGRQLYIYYYTSPNQYRTRYWVDWDYQYMRTVTDIANSSIYYQWGNTGFTGIDGMLTQALSAVSGQLSFGEKFSYNWVNAGWAAEGRPPMADPVRYEGYLKSYYTAGMIGGVAGYFGRDDPTNWIWQYMTLGKVHALFSHLEPFVRASDLLSGPNHHLYTALLSACEFPTGDAEARVLARKHNDRDEWLLTAWAAGGEARTVSVEIPVLGLVALEALPEAAIYIAHLEDGLPVVRTFVPSPLMMPGDMDGSGAVNNNDVAPFVLALTDRAAYEAHYPLIDADVVGDIDGSGAMTNNDITPFVGLLTAGPQAVPEPATLALLAFGAAALLKRKRKP